MGYGVKERTATDWCGRHFLPFMDQGRFFPVQTREGDSVPRYQEPSTTRLAWAQTAGGGMTGGDVDSKNPEASCREMRSPFRFETVRPRRTTNKAFETRAASVTHGFAQQKSGDGPALDQPWKSLLYLNPILRSRAQRLHAGHGAALSEPLRGEFAAPPQAAGSRGQPCQQASRPWSGSLDFSAPRRKKAEAR
jgi:hypothetical protein